MADFSFSGLKTALLYKVNELSESLLKSEVSNIAACYQETIIDTLFEKLNIVLNQNKTNDILIVGGVSANTRFREKSQQFEKTNNVNIIFPDFKYCTDNAAMIAMAGYIKYKKGIISNLDITPYSSIDSYSALITSLDCRLSFFLDNQRKSGVKTKASTPIRNNDINNLPKIKFHIAAKIPRIEISFPSITSPTSQ